MCFTYPFCILLPESLFQQFRLETYVICIDDTDPELPHCIVSKMLQGQLNGRPALKARPCCVIDVVHQMIIAISANVRCSRSPLWISCRSSQVRCFPFFLFSSMVPPLRRRIPYHYLIFCMTNFWLPVSDQKFKIQLKKTFRKVWVSKVIWGLIFPPTQCENSINSKVIWGLDLGADMKSKQKGAVALA